MQRLVHVREPLIIHQVLVKIVDLSHLTYENYPFIDE